MSKKKSNQQSNLRIDPSYFQLIFNYIQDGIIIMDQRRKIVLMNPSAERLTGWQVGGIVPYCSFCETRNLQEGEEQCYLLSKREVPYFLSAMPTYEGKYIDMEMSTAVIFENKETEEQEILLVLKDYAIKKKEEEARLSKVVIQRTLEAQENEHKRIAQELHDGIGQSLYSVSVGLQAIRSQLQYNVQLKEYMDEMVNELDKLIQNVNLYSKQMRPLSLDQFGLIPTVNHLIQTLNKQHEQVQIHLLIDPQMQIVKLSPTQEINIYRVIQEALHNALKYSKSSQINIKLLVDRGFPDYLHVSIIDNGQGFDIEKGKSGLGLRHMMERVDQMEGVLTIESEDGKGTKILAKIPLKEGEL